MKKFSEWIAEANQKTDLMKNPQNIVDDLTLNKRCPDCNFYHKQKKCPDCGTEMHFSKHCGALVCDKCDNHDGLARCFCGWSKTSPGRGREELEDAGETIDPEDGGFGF